VLNDAILIEDAIEDGERTAAVDHVVFGDDLEPVDDGFLLEDVTVVRNAEADADSIVCEPVEAICWHVQPRKRN
jgi:hypothetical protein